MNETTHILFGLSACVGFIAIAVRVTIAVLDFRRQNERNASQLFRAFKKDIDKLELARNPATVGGKAVVVSIIDNIVDENILGDPTFTDLTRHHRIILKSRCEMYLMHRLGVEHNIKL